VSANELGDDDVLPSLIAAGMNAGTLAATVGADDNQHYNALLEHIVHVIGSSYGTRTLYHELCSTSALVLMLRGQNVRIGEVVFSRRDQVWTFTVEDDVAGLATGGLTRAAQLIAVYANVLQQFQDDWDTKVNPFWEPSSGIAADEDAWEQLMRAVPEDDVIVTAKALFVVTGVLSKWATK